MGQAETFEGNKMTGETLEKIVNDISKMTTEELMKEYFKLRDETDWAIMENFSEINRKLNEMANELRRRNYGKDEPTRTDNSGEEVVL
jgi:hypothetical protein